MASPRDGDYVRLMRRSTLVAIISLSAAIAWLSACDSNAGGDEHRVDGAEARRLVAEGAFLLDVRSPGEFGAGHIEGAANIPISELDARLSEVPTDTPVVVYCLSGGRSASAARTLEAAGRRVYDLGAMSAW